MRNIKDIRADLASYKSLMKRQGDFTLYASKYIQDVEVLMSLLPAEKAPKKETPTSAPTSTKKKVTLPSDSKD